MLIISCGSSLKVFKASAKVFILLFGPSWEVKLCFPTKSNNEEVSMLEFLGGSEVARFSFFVFLDMKICLPTIFCATCALFSRNFLCGSPLKVKLCFPTRSSEALLYSKV